MNNIFRGAKFGDKFLTRNGKIAIYHYYNGNIMNQHKLIIEDGWGIICRSDGSEAGYNESDNDIVSKYQKLIYKDKLQKLAAKEANKWYKSVKSESNYNFWRECYECFKAGYLKAKEE